MHSVQNQGAIWENPSIKHLEGLVNIEVNPFLKFEQVQFDDSQGRRKGQHSGLLLVSVVNVYWAIITNIWLTWHR